MTSRDDVPLLFSFFLYLFPPFSTFHFETDWKKFIIIIINIFIIVIIMVGDEKTERDFPLLFLLFFSGDDDHISRDNGKGGG